MVNVIEKEENEYNIKIIEGKNGKQTVIKTLISTEEFHSVEPRPTIEQQILAENQYQTALLEMTMMGGN